MLNKGMQLLNHDSFLNVVLDVLSTSCFTHYVFCVSVHCSMLLCLFALNITYCTWMDLNIVYINGNVMSNNK